LLRSAVNAITARRRAGARQRATGARTLVKVRRAATLLMAGGDAADRPGPVRGGRGDLS